MASEVIKKEVVNIQGKIYPCFFYNSLGKNGAQGALKCCSKMQWILSCGNSWVVYVCTNGESQGLNFYTTSKQTQTSISRILLYEKIDINSIYKVIDVYYVYLDLMCRSIQTQAQFTCLTYGSVNFHDQLYGRLEIYGSVSTYG